jgi:hypothetical protein
MKKTLIWLVCTVLLSVAAGASADPIQDSSLNDYKAGWYPNYYKEKGPLTCPQTCEIWIKGVAEQENSMAADSKMTQVCKIGDRGQINKPVRGGRCLYGNQFDKTPACYVTDMNGKVQKSERYYCLCIAKTQSECPDLVVTEIKKPVWDNANSRSVITAVIKNIGGGAAGPSIARVIDPSTKQPTGAPYNAIANTPALAAGASATVVFYLPYWVYNPDASLEVTADYKNNVKECNENNNTKVFNDQG